MLNGIFGNFKSMYLLNQNCLAVRSGKNSANQETGLGNRGTHLKVLNDTKLILNDQGVSLAHLGPIWYHSRPSYIPQFPNQSLGWDFFCRFLQQDGSTYLDCLIVFKSWSELCSINSFWCFASDIHHTYTQWLKSKWRVAFYKGLSDKFNLSLRQ